MSTQLSKTKSAPSGKKKATKKKPQGAKLEWNPDKGLSVPEELFCRAYVLNEATRRNATLSYDFAFQKNLDDKPKDDAVYANDEGEMEDFEDDEMGEGRRPRGRGKLITPSSYDRCYSVCATEGSKLLKRPHIYKRITKLLNDMLTDEFVDGELTKVIAQDDELTPKVNAIKEFNTLRKRTTTTTVEHKFKDLESMTDAELAAEEARLDEFFSKGKKKAKTK